MVYGQKDRKLRIDGESSQRSGWNESIFVPELNRFYVAVSCQDGPNWGQIAKYRFLIYSNRPPR